MKEASEMKYGDQVEGQDTFIYITGMKRSDYCNYRRREPTVVM